MGIYGTSLTQKAEKALTNLDKHPFVSQAWYHKTIAKKLDKEEHSIDDLCSAELDFIMVVGGDGTILRLLQNFDGRVLGVNTGRIGFLTSVDLKNLEDALQGYNDGDYFLDERIKLKTILNGEEIVECTNEAVVHTDRVAKIREFEVYQGKKRVDRFRADGVIISTPTGSTCYSMSSGGPILHPDVDAFVVVPISPFKLATTPYVVPVDEEIKVVLTEKDKQCILVLDGQKEIKVKPEDDIRFRLGDTKAKFIVFDKDFYSRVRKKLVWR